MSNSYNINTIGHYAFKYCSIIAFTHYSIKNENNRNQQLA